MSIVPEWHKVIHRFDEIWCASSFIARAISSISARPVHIVRPALDFKIIPSNRDRQSFGLPNNAYVFFYTADAGSGIERKNLKSLIGAYVREFGPEDGTCCLVKLHYSQTNSNEWQQIVEVSEGRPDVILMNQLLNDEDMTALFQNVDCYVSPHRSEGLGLTILEAMNAGVPVIATPYGGVTDFVKEDTSFLLDYKLTEVSPYNEPYLPGYLWADPGIESIQMQMRYVIEHPDVAKEKVRNASNIIPKLFSQQITSNLMLQELKRIWHQGSETIS